MGIANPIGPESCYNEGKLSAVTLFFDDHMQYNFLIEVTVNFTIDKSEINKTDGRIVLNLNV